MAMLNATVLRLAVSSLSSSPFLAPRDAVHVSHSGFSRHFSHVGMAAEQFASLSAPSTIFSHALRSAVRIESESFSSETFNGPKKCSSPGDYVFQSCLFQDCDTNENGGAIQISNRRRGNLKVSKTGFLKCNTGKQGGAIYADAAEVDLSKSCVSQCSASEFAGFYASGSSSIEVADCWITDIGESCDEAVISVSNDNAAVRSCNISNIDLPSCQSVLVSPGDSVNVRDIYFGKCDIESVVRIEGSSDPMRAINFVKNSAKESLVDQHDYIASFISCAFIKDDSQYICNKYAILNACFFSDGLDRGQFPSDYTTTKVETGVGWKTIDIDVYASANCWALMPKPPAKEAPAGGNQPSDGSPSSPAAGAGKKSASYVLGVSIVVILAVGVLFFGFRWWRNRDDTGRLLRMYSEV